MTETARRPSLVIAGVDPRDDAVASLDGGGPQNRFQVLFDLNPSPVMLINRETLHFIAINDAALEFYGYSRAAFLNLRLPDIRPEKIQGEIAGMIERFDDPTLPDVPRLHLTRSGERRIVRVSARELGYDGVPAILATIFDMTRQQRMEDEVRRARAFLKNVVDRVPSALFAKDAETGQYIFYNSAAERVFGHTREQVVGRTSSEIFPPAEAQRMLKQDQEALVAGPTGITAEEIIARPDGHDRYIRLKKVLITDGASDEKRYILGVAEDVTEERLREAEIAHLASHDVLTGLANRWLFHQRLQDAQRNASGSDDLLAIHYIDLDGFKAVNDTMGHATGDLLLKSVADRMLKAVRRSDLVARFGGDEFAILQTSIRNGHEATSLAERLVEGLAQPYEIGEAVCRVSASVGVSLATIRSPAERIIESADSALYAAKRGGRRRYVFQHLSEDAGTKM